ncbi:MAG: zinc-binding dehydrogenase [Saprospirales bacterium]|nr:zinc-binding dehydrogenase [Saprospirales bacterium]MBK8491364.1 zinc-binding dehydrogenase [Saprospirales bacterium]
MKISLPATMQAVQLDEMEQPLAVREIPVPKPGPGQVLVHMAASPINPSDLAFLLGGYGFKEPLPLTPGNEGSGTVVAVGSGLMARRLLGKRVACFARMGHGGAWAEYMLTNASLCIPVGKKITLDQASMSLVNPLTALAFMDIVRLKKHPAFVNTAAASALGQMLVRLSIRQGVPLLNVVRKEAQADQLRAIGAKYVLNSTAPDFEKKLKELTHQLQVSLMLDAVGGPMLGQLLNASPRGGTILSYGRLSAETCVIEPGELILKNKRIVGFLLSDWMQKKNLLQILADIRRVQRMLGEELQTPVKKRMPFSDINEALASYQEEMSGGKILMVGNINKTTSV